MYDGEEKQTKMLEQVNDDDVESRILLARTMHTKNTLLL